ncbi:hypothetical protein [Fluviicola sp.]|uniref:hypothetical protein n=1 Tax=Fluviicola sp. TaxID=1917219 RepID=UPI0031E4772C
MTLKEKLATLRIDFELKSDLFLKAEQKLWDEGNGFFDKKLLDQLAEAKLAYHKAEKEYLDFLTEILMKKPNIHAEM